MNSRKYSYSDCISQANKEMAQANFYATKTGNLYECVRDIHAQAADYWFAFARIANRHGAVNVVTFFSGIPVKVQ